MKHKLRRACYQFFKCDGIQILIILAVLVLFVAYNVSTDHSLPALIDLSVFVSTFTALMLSSVSVALKPIFLNLLEDSAKLTCEYGKLASKYNDAAMIVFDNAGARPENLRRLPRDAKPLARFPVIRQFPLCGCQVRIEDSRRRYALPDEVAAHFDELFAAHSTSKVYNQLNIRVDDWFLRDDVFVMKTSRTSFFDSLVTNRAMDFRWSNGLTVRERFAFGPHLGELRDSVLSNHIGFNGFVESSDGFVVFVRRSGALSIGKRTYGDSIGASLKAKYALNDAGDFTPDGLLNGILREIDDELKLPREALEDLRLERCLIAAYRDLVEGGKPQLLFFARARWSRQEIQQNFVRRMKGGKKGGKASLLEDGDTFLWIPARELDGLCVLPDRMIFRGKTYPMMPSASASVVMLIDHLKESGRSFEDPGELPAGQKA